MKPKSHPSSRLRPPLKLEFPGHGSPPTPACSLHRSWMTRRARSDRDGGCGPRRRASREQPPAPAGGVAAAGRLWSVSLPSVTMRCGCSCSPLAYNLASFLRSLALPDHVAGSRSLTTLHQRLVKIGARVVRHGRSPWIFQLAEFVVPRALVRRDPAPHRPACYGSPGAERPEGARAWRRSEPMESSCRESWLAYRVAPGRRPG